MADPVTLQNVADAAGVSIATASRALTGRNRVSKQTVAHVTRVAARLGYRPNAFGRALREGASRTIGVVVPVVGNPFYGRIVHELETELAEHGYDLVIADSHGDVERERARLRMLADRRVAAIIIVPADTVASADALVEAESFAPVVQLDRRVFDHRGDFVGVDNDRGITLLLEHLEAEGAKRVVLVASNAVTSAGRERRSAFERESARLELEVDEAILDEFTFEFGRLAAQQLMARGTLPDAVVCGDDLIATGLMTAIKHAGYRVPADVLVTGFDGTLLADICDPPLTTIEQPFRELARETVAALVRRIGDRSSAVVLRRVEPALRVAGSTR